MVARGVILVNLVSLLNLSGLFLKLIFDKHLHSILSQVTQKKESRDLSKDSFLFFFITYKYFFNINSL